MSTRFVVFLMAAALVAAASTRTAPAQGARTAAPLPQQALIRGVPFVSWREAQSHGYPHQEFVNPSIEAVREMIAWYWNDTLPSAWAAARLANSPAWLALTGDSAPTSFAPSLDSVKALVSRGIPVAVYLPMTPYGHPLNPPLAMAIGMGMVRKVALPNGPFSGTAPRMFPLELAPELTAAARELGRGDTIWTAFNESALASPRVVIGYDDARGVLIVHGPIFGPAFEMSTAEFERMWGAAGRRGYVIVRPDLDAVLARHASAPPYRAPTPRERAAFEYFSGYALASTGRVAEGIAHYRAGLAVVDGDTTYHYLLLLDLALSLEWQGEMNQALAAADSAARLVPEDPRVWAAIGRIASRSTLPDRDRRVKAARDRYERLKRDRAARDRLDAKVHPDCYTVTFRVGVRE